MESMVVRSHVGADGLLKIQVPVHYKDADLDVALVVQPATGAALLPPARPLSQEDWRAFVTRMAGCIKDPTFVRHEQGQFETREEL
jgi:hypothetical protein